MRSLRMKLVFIMVLLIVALMTVVGSFLINGVGNFYIEEFYIQMEQTFSEEFILQMRQTATQNNAPERLKEQLMAQADFVSLHCPSTPETRGLINGEMLGLMKPTAYLINTARGPVIDEPALLDALTRRSIAGAGLDVFPGEPHINPALWQLDNVILTPHIGSNTAGTRYDMAAEAGRQILRVLAGDKPENLING